MRAAGLPNTEVEENVMADVEQKQRKGERSEMMREELAVLRHLQAWLQLVTQMTILQTHP
jgi:hypothetical protein